MPTSSHSGRQQPTLRPPADSRPAARSSGNSSHAGSDPGAVAAAAYTPVFTSRPRLASPTSRPPAAVPALTTPNGTWWRTCGWTVTVGARRAGARASRSRREVGCTSRSPFITSSGCSGTPYWAAGQCPAVPGQSGCSGGSRSAAEARPVAEVLHDQVPEVVDATQTRRTPPPTSSADALRWPSGRRPAAAAWEPVLGQRHRAWCPGRRPSPSPSCLAAGRRQRRCLGAGRRCPSPSTTATCSSARARMRSRTSARLRVGSTVAGAGLAGGSHTGVLVRTDATADGRGVGGGVLTGWAYAGHGQCRLRGEAVGHRHGPREAHVRRTTPFHFVPRSVVRWAVWHFRLTAEYWPRVGRPDWIGTDYRSVVKLWDLEHGAESDSSRAIGMGSVFLSGSPPTVRCWPQVVSIAP